MKSIVYSVLLLAVGLSLFSGTGPNGYIVGDKAADFTLKNVDGNMFALSSMKHVKGYIVVFTCNHCPYAQLYEQRIIDLNKKYKSKGFPVIAINPNSPEVVPEDSFGEMQVRAKAKKYTFPYLFDEAQTVFPQFGATRTPHVFVLDSARMVRYIGAIDNNPESPEEARDHYVESAVEALLRGELPTPDFTRAIGCPIKVPNLKKKH